MTLARWDPFQNTVPLRDAMTRLVDESVFRPAGGWATSAVAMDVYAEGDNYVIEAAVPGLAPDAIDVTVLGNQVTISGEYPAGVEGRRYLFRERAGGRFERTVTLGADLDADKVQAHYEHGVLRLVIPKAEFARPKRIEIGSGTAASGALSSGS